MKRLIGCTRSVLLVIGSALPVAAQGPTVVTTGGFVPGGQVLYASNFAQDPIGNFPSGLKYVRGPLEVVQVNGIPMLRSTGPAEFIIPLSAPLPQDFTLEFDLVARNSNCCSGEELAFEGSPQLNRSVGSAWVAWHHQYSGIIGGGQIGHQHGAVPGGLAERAARPAGADPGPGERDPVQAVHQRAADLQHSRPGVPADHGVADLSGRRG